MLLRQSDYGVFANWNDDEDFDFISAPTVALALKWLRDVKEVFFDISVARLKNSKEVIYGFGFFHVDDEVDYGNYQDQFSNYEAAESALLDALLEKIENKVE